MEQLGRADLHLHTTTSDGLASVQEVLECVVRRSHLDVIAITDHDTLEASLWACERRGEYPFDIVPGLEITAAGGHVLGLWVTQPVPYGLSLMETTAAIHEQGGVAVLAHPFHFHIPIALRHCWRYLWQPNLLVEWGFDAVEAHNAGVITPLSNRLARRLGRQTGLAVTGSSDAHTAGAVGSGQTRFLGRTADDLRAALEMRQTIAEGHAWPLADYLEIAQALPHWVSPGARVPVPDADAELA